MTPLPGVTNVEHVTAACSIRIKVCSKISVLYIAT